MEGVLLVDKPSGPTSHDVVARVRRLLGERRIGHTGTLDHLASGLLPLVVGTATRLAPYLTASDKTYEATVRLGFATDTDDAGGRPLAAPEGLDAASLDDDRVRSALERFLGRFDQRPPAHSAKRIAGVRAYALARHAQPVDVRPVGVTVRQLEWLGRRGDRVMIRVTASAGFYVRALARDLGTALRCGGHLEALRRTASGGFRVSEAVSLEEAEHAGSELAGRLIAPADALPRFPAVTLLEAGARRVSHGNWVGPEHLDSAPPFGNGANAQDGARDLVRLLAPGTGRLLALARPRGGALHPVVVLG
jgi:tRNA pseudouridine55 synthase